MKITQKDADELAKLEFALFNFNPEFYGAKTICSERLMTQLLTLVDFLPDIGITFPYYHWQGKSCTKEELKSYIKSGKYISLPIDSDARKRENTKFFNGLVGLDSTILEDLFYYATPPKTSAYFFKKDLLIPDALHKIFISNLRDGNFNLRAKTSSLKIDYLLRMKGRLVQDISIFQKYYDSIIAIEKGYNFKDKDRQEYLLNDLLIQKIMALILFERPDVEVDTLLATHSKMLGTKKLKTFTSQLETVKPKIAEKIEAYAGDSVESFELQTTHLIDKIYTIDVESMALQYQKTVNNTKQKLDEYLCYIAKELGVQYQPLRSSVEIHQFIISAENHELLQIVIKEMINHKDALMIEELRKYVITNVAVIKERFLLDAEVTSRVVRKVVKL